MKVGIFGGSFNPVHNGHLGLVDKVLEDKLVDEVWLMPCGRHAFNKNLTAASDRAEMLRLGIIGKKNVKISRLEIDNPGISYTYDSLMKLKHEYSEDFYLIIGADILKDLNPQKWQGYEELCKIGKFIVFNRKGYEIRNPGINMSTIYLEDAAISSTEVRNRIKQGLSIEGMVPKSVGDYIQQNRLYQ